MTQPQQPQKSYDNPSAKPSEENKSGVQFRPGQNQDEPSRKGPKPEDDDNDHSSLRDNSTR